MHRIAIISDIHANREALDAVLADIPDVDALYCLGDVVGYGPDPVYCIERLAEAGMPCILGNHDEGLVQEGQLDWFNAPARKALQWQRAQLDESHLTWLASLPRSLVVDDMTLVHGAPPDSNRTYIEPDGKGTAEAMADVTTSFCAVGHTHVPVLLLQEARLWLLYRRNWTPVLYGDRNIVMSLRRRCPVLVNVGSVGQPRDGIPLAAYALIDREQRRFEFRRVEYDIESVQQKMYRAGLPEFLGARLSIGV